MNHLTINNSPYCANNYGSWAMLMSAAAQDNRGITETLQMNRNGLTSMVMAN